MSITSRGILSAAYPVDTVIAQEMRDRVLDDKSHRAALLIAPEFVVRTTEGTYPVLESPPMQDIDDDPVTPIAFGAPLADAELVYSNRPYNLTRWDGGKFLLPGATLASFLANGMDPAAGITRVFTQRFFNKHAYKVFSALNATANYNGGASTHQYDPGNATSSTFALPVELTKVKERFERDAIGAPNLVVIASNVLGYLLQNDFVRNLETGPREGAVASGTGPLQAYLREVFEEPGLNVVVSNGAYRSSGTETAYFSGRMAFLRCEKGGSGPSWCNTVIMGGESGVDMFDVRSKFDEERNGTWYYSDSHWGVNQGTPTAGVLWKDLLSG